MMKSLFVLCNSIMRVTRKDKRHASRYTRTHDPDLTMNQRHTESVFVSLDMATHLQPKRQKFKFKLQVLFPIY